MATKLRPGNVRLVKIAAIVGARHVLTASGATRFYRKGFRTPEGEADFVVRPGSLVELWLVLEYCIAQGAVVIVQAANTGLTGGSTPAQGGYDRDVVLISVRRIRGIMAINGAEQVLCFPGATLHELEQFLKPWGREPHSVIGSSCFGASVIGGICNNSGGSLVQRGPAFTRYAIFARVRDDGSLELVNHLGINLGHDPVAVLTRLDEGDFSRILHNETAAPACDCSYEITVRDIDADTPARHNADPRYLHEASGSAGKIVVFAVRLDSFVRTKNTQTFYIGTRYPERFAELRRRILGGNGPLPIAAEYLHAEAFDMADLYGKDQFLLIQKLGTQHLPKILAIKSWLDGLLERFIPNKTGLLDCLLHYVARFLPDHLPSRMRQWRARFDHHLLIKVGEDDAVSLRATLDSWMSDDDSMFECTQKEAAQAFLHRFVIAGAAVRYKVLHTSAAGENLSLDIALRRNERDWFEVLPPDVANQIIHSIYYGHFLCHVLHQDYVLAPGADVDSIKAAMLEQLDRRGARYPAEHNVGHTYHAAPDLATFYRDLDPTNSLNPGIGKMSRRRHYAEDAKVKMSFTAR